MRDPAQMSSEERTGEIAAILAAAIIRLKNRKLRKNNQIELYSESEESVCGTTQGGGE